MTEKQLSLVAENIQTTKQIWLDRIEGVSDEMRNWLREDCRERFRYCITTYYGDHCHGIIDIGNLAEVLDDEIEELEDLSPALVSELCKIRQVAQDNKIDEILFD